MSEVVDPVSSDRRRNWGLGLLAGGGMSMTLFAAVTLWMLYERQAPPSYLLYMGLGALILIGIVLTGFSALLVKRTFRFGRDGVVYSDNPSAPLSRPYPDPEFGFEEKPS